MNVESAITIVSLFNNIMIPVRISIAQKQGHFQSECCQQATGKGLRGPQINHQQLEFHSFDG